MKKDINHKKAIEILNSYGVKVIGSSRYFSSRYHENGLWIDAEGSSIDCFSNDKWFNTDGVNPAIANELSSIGYWSEWQDSGTLMLWNDYTDELVDIYEKEFSSAL